MTPVVSAAFALLSLCFEPRRAGAVLAGGVLFALGQSSLFIAGGPHWRGAGLPPSYLSVTAAFLAAGAVWSLLAGYRRRTALRVPFAVAVILAVLLAVLAGWVLTPVALDGGLGRTALTLALLGLCLAALVRAAQWVTRRWTRSSLPDGIKP